MGIKYVSPPYPTSSESFKTELKHYFQSNNTSDINKFSIWNAQKAYIRGICIQQGAKIRKERKKQGSQLMQSIEQLEKL